MNRNLPDSDLDDAGVAAEPDASPRIVFIDPDDMFRTAMAACLRTEGFIVLEYDRYRAAIDRIVANGDVDAILLDADIGTCADDSLLDHFLRLGVGVPVALMASRCTNGHEEAALARGAADYLGKSRGPTIVAKRLRLLIGARNAGSSGPAEETRVDIGPLTLRLASHRAVWRGRQVPLTVTEFKIVRLLASNPGGKCSHREIYDVVHGAGFAAGDGPDGYRTNVRSLIRKIRSRFRSLDAGFDEIENVAGYGYQWRPAEARAPLSRAVGERTPFTQYATPLQA